jgi:hypothetical protein
VTVLRQRFVKFPERCVVLFEKIRIAGTIRLHLMTPAEIEDHSESEDDLNYRSTISNGSRRDGIWSQVGANYHPQSNTE